MSPFKIKADSRTELHHERLELLLKKKHKKTQRPSIYLCKLDYRARITELKRISCAAWEQSAVTKGEGNAGYQGTDKGAVELRFPPLSCFTSSSHLS